MSTDFTPITTTAQPTLASTAQHAVTLTPVDTDGHSNTTTNIHPVHPEVTWRDLDAAKDINSLGCLSTVLRPNGPWYDRHFLIPHEAIRYDMLLMERALQPQYFQPRRTWKVRRFFQWYQTYFVEPVHHHHDTEEKLYFPWVLQKPGVTMPHRMTDDHVTLLRQLDEIAAMERKFAGTMDSAQLDTLAAELLRRVSDMCEHMRDHLAEEERIIPPLLRDNFTEPESLAVINQIVKSRGLDNFHLAPNELMCQWRAGGEESRGYLLSLMPGVMRSHYWRFSVTWYPVEQLQSINDIMLDSDTEPKKPKPHGCGLCRWYD